MLVNVLRSLLIRWLTIKISTSGVLECSWLQFKLTNPMASIPAGLEEMHLSLQLEHNFITWIVVGVYFFNYTCGNV